MSIAKVLGPTGRATAEEQVEVRHLVLSELPPVAMDETAADVELRGIPQLLLHLCQGLAGLDHALFP